MVEKYHKRYREVYKNMYKDVDFRKGPYTYVDENLYDKMFRFGSFGLTGKEVTILDLGASKGVNVGVEMTTRFLNLGKKVNLYASDIIFNQDNIKGIEEKAKNKIKEKIGNKELIEKLKIVLLPNENSELDLNKKFDVIFQRYNLKNSPEKDQLTILKNSYNMLKDDGRVIIVDMISPYGLEKEANYERDYKAETKGGKWFGRIHSVIGWIKLFKEAGFKVNRAVPYTSNVITSDWVRSNQMEMEKLNLYYENVKKLTEFLKHYSVNLIELNNKLEKDEEFDKWINEKTNNNPRIVKALARIKYPVCIFVLTKDREI